MPLHVSSTATAAAAAVSTTTTTTITTSMLCYSILGSHFSNKYLLTYSATNTVRLKPPTCTARISTHNMVTRVKKLETSSTACCEMHIDILNRLGATYKCYKGKDEWIDSCICRATCKLRGSVLQTRSYCRSKFYIAETEIFNLFCSCDRVLGPMTFMCKLDQYYQEIHWTCKYELPTLRFSKVSSDRQTGLKLYTMLLRA